VSDEGILAILALAMIAGLVLLLVAMTPSAEDIQTAIQEGRVVNGMSKSQVRLVWGEPDSLEMMTTKSPLGATEGLVSALAMSRLEQALTFYTYTVWVYSNPMRTATFDQYGKVVRHEGPY